MALLSTKLPWELAQTKWSGTLNPIISLPILGGNQINNIFLPLSTALAPKPIAINHLLQRLPQGWIIVDKDSDANIWRTAPYNQNTLILESDADTTISLWIY